jgi:antitoxin component YwqK of YwqJK toxin-antitoxin module
MTILDKDVARAIKESISDSITVCRFSQVCRSANLQKITELPNGEKHGLYKTYHPDGQLWYEGTWKDGERHGWWKEYYPNGQLRREGIRKNDLKQGLWKYYHENGWLGFEGTFKDDNEHGLWKYNTTGKMASWNLKKLTVVVISLAHGKNTTKMGSW